jgi:RNA polymerase sigma-70 factor (ECF subfamily)
LLARVRIGPRLRSKLDADDLLQEAFLRAHQAIGRFRGTTREEFLAWLRGILAHVLADQIRRYHGTEQRDPNLERGLECALERSSEEFVRALAAPTSSPSQRVVRHERALRLAEGMERLPPAAREVLVLRHFQNLSFPEIARRMDRTLDGVKNLWIRALARLRREVAALDEWD